MSIWHKLGIRVEGSTIHKIPLLDWAVGKPAVHFLKYWLKRDGLAI